MKGSLVVMPPPLELTREWQCKNSGSIPAAVPACNNLIATNIEVGHAGRVGKDTVHMLKCFRAPCSDLRDWSTVSRVT